MAERPAADPSPQLEALVLAGRRGPGDPVAAAAGVSHKALAPVAGLPMIVRVVRSLRAVASVRRVLVSIDEPPLLETLPELAAWRSEGFVEIRRSAGSPSASVLSSLEERPRHKPLLVTTADHPLLTAQMIGHFGSVASARGADVAVGVVTESLLKKYDPTVKRTFISLRGERLTGANLFLFRTPRSIRAPEFWARAERFRKQPWRLVSVFGPHALLLFALNRLDLEAALARASRVMGIRIEGIRMPFPECALDVDHPAHLELAARILAGRPPEGSRSRPAQPARGERERGRARQSPLDERD